METDEFGNVYDELFISDYDIEGIDLDYKQLGEYPSFEELNYLAGRLDELTSYEFDAYEAILESGIDIEEPGLSGLINLTYNLGRFHIYPDVDEAGYGYLLVEDQVSNLGWLKSYIDYGRIGRDTVIEQGGVFYDGGYVYDSYESWDYEYQYGVEGHGIPDEYKLFNADNSEKTNLKDNPIFQKTAGTGSLKKDEQSL